MKAAVVYDSTWQSTSLMARAIADGLAAGVPMSMIFVGGEPKETLTGSPSRAEILNALKVHLPA